LVLLGYKLRTHIAKALQRRSDAIRAALARYNQQAAKLKPPRPSLSWKQIVDYSFLGEFDILRHSRTDIRTEDWAKPGRRELTTKHMELCRAREEVERLNVEIKCLRTAMRDEALEYRDAISTTSKTDLPLASELRRRWGLRRAIHALHERRLAQVMSGSGFTGSMELGVRLGKDAPTDPESMQVEAGDLSWPHSGITEEVLHSEPAATGYDGLEDSAVAMHAFSEFVDGIDT